MLTTEAVCSYLNKHYRDLVAQAVYPLLRSIWVGGKFVPYPENGE